MRHPSSLFHGSWLFLAYIRVLSPVQAGARLAVPPQSASNASSAFKGVKRRKGAGKRPPGGQHEKVQRLQTSAGPQALISLILPPAWLAFWFIPGFKGNAWREQSLQDRGYELIDTVRSATARSAMARLAQSM